MYRLFWNYQALCTTVKKTNQILWANIAANFNSGWGGQIVKDNDDDPGDYSGDGDDDADDDDD